MARVVALVGDLMLASRVQGSLEAAGHEVSRVPRLEPSVLRGAELIVADLDATPPEQLADLQAPVLGFHQHTNVEIRRRAESAGLELAVPRSRLVRELPSLAQRLLGG